MSSSIKAFQKQIINLDNNRCQLLDENGNTLAEFNGKMMELCGQIFVTQDNKIYDIVINNGKYCLQENSGTIDP